MREQLAASREEAAAAAAALSAAHEEAARSAEEARPGRDMGEIWGRYWGDMWRYGGDVGGALRRGGAPVQSAVAGPRRERGGSYPLSLTLSLTPPLDP